MGRKSHSHFGRRYKDVLATDPRLQAPWPPASRLRAHPCGRGRARLYPRCPRPGQADPHRLALRSFGPLRGGGLGRLRRSARRSRSTSPTSEAACSANTRSRPVNADSQSKPDVAINEAERLINQENVDVILGVYSSAHAVPLAARSRSRRRSCGSTRAVATSVLKDQQPQLRVPRADPLRSVWRGRRSASWPRTPSQARRRPQGPQGRDHLRGRPLRHRRAAGGRAICEASRHARSCSRKPIRRTRPIFPRSSPS